MTSKFCAEAVASIAGATCGNVKRNDDETARNAQIKCFYSPKTDHKALKHNLKMLIGEFERKNGIFVLHSILKILTWLPDTAQSGPLWRHALRMAVMSAISLSLA